MLMLAGIDDPKLDSTASHPSTSSHSLPCCVVCHPGHAPCADDYGWSGSTASVHILSLSIDRQSVSVSVSVSATVTAVSEPSVSAVVSVTAILRRHFRLRPKPEKNWFRSVSPSVLLFVFFIAVIYGELKIVIQ